MVNNLAHRSSLASTPNPGKDGPGRPVLATDGRGGVFVCLYFAAWLLLAPLILIGGAVLASGALSAVKVDE